MRLEVQGGRWRYTDEVLTADAELAGGQLVHRGHRCLGPEVPHRVESGLLLVLATLLQGVKATVNPVSASFADLSG